jgi:flagellar biosynthesis protein FlhB
MFVPIWMLLSWLVRQVESGFDEEAEEPEADPGEPYEPAVQMIKIGIAAFSLLLLGLSISAYKKTALKSIVYAAIAFALFAAQLFFDYLEDAVEGWEQPFNDVIFYAMTLAILVLFFIAIVRRGGTQKA